MLMTFRKQKGTTLVELMIATAISVAALATLSSLIGFGMGLNAKLLSNARLNEELGNAMLLISRDVRRAGYNGNTVNFIQDPAANPSAFTTSVSMSEFTGETADSCVTFSYDNNGNGIVDLGANSENFGYRLRDGRIEMRINDLSCTALGWIEVTDPSIVDITGLSFTLNQSVENGVTSTEILMTMSGELSANAAINRRFEERIVVRNYD